MRVARAADEERLRELMFESKAHWGYERDLVRRWADGHTFGSGEERWVAEAGGEIVAWAGIVPPAESVAFLEDLWVDPTWMGRGLGGRLFRLAVDRARELGAHAVRLESDPNAVPFYERMGATTVGTATSEWGRELPVMEVTL